jgi:hypothetical protein
MFDYLPTAEAWADMVMTVSLLWSAVVVLTGRVEALEETVFVLDDDSCEVVGCVADAAQ